MAKQISPFQIRFPPEVKALVDESAARHYRSINADVVERVRASFEGEGRGLDAYETGDLIQELISRRAGIRITVEIVG